MKHFKLISGVRKWHFCLIALVIFALLAVLDFAFPPPLKRGENFSPLITDKSGYWVHAFTNDKGNWRFKASLDDIEPEFIERLLLIEDKRFYNHQGIDLVAVMRALKSAFQSGKIVSGASTITMQTARLLEPRPRNIGSKIIEMLRALQIERRLSKNEILTLYLTMAPYGSNIEGIRAASLTWFDKEPAHLTPAEQALLIALPQAPEARRPDRRTKTALQARAKIINKFISLGTLSPNRGEEALKARLPQKKQAFTNYAWHLSYALARDEKLNRASNKGVIKSSLDLGLQQASEKLVSDYIATLNSSEVTKQSRKNDPSVFLLEDAHTTASMMIIDHHTQEIRTLVGSSSRDVRGGWIDLTKALRSPGSTLKPFIYGLAFEDGILTANTVIQDMPRRFGDYSPENFDRSFRGEVRIRDALQHSLNIPAVAALDAVGAARFSAAVSMAGADLKTRTSADQKPGLALALGGAGIRMRDLARLYGALATDGYVHPLKAQPLASMQDKAPEGYQFFSRQTAQKIANILYEVPSLKGRVPAKLAKNAPRIAFKTGTSYGFRDAWAAGFNDHYTVIVWIGRADGAPRPGATGRSVAAPLLFSVFDMIEQTSFSEEDRVENNKDHDSFEDPVLAKITVQEHQRKSPRKSPTIIFPRDGVEIFIGPQTQKRGIALSARGADGHSNWYVDGRKIMPDPIGARHLWYPEKEGFYNISVIDQGGQSASVNVRVRDDL